MLVDGLEFLNEEFLKLVAEFERYKKIAGDEIDLLKKQKKRRR